MIYAHYKTELGDLTIAREQSKICLITLDKRDTEGSFVERDEVLDKAHRQIEEYLQHKRVQFDLDFDIQGNAFSVKVFQEVVKIPYGSTMTYKDIAQCIGHPYACRAVGMALKRNPILFLVPCHRVIGKGGKLTGFAYGVEKKRYLLELEKAI